MTNTNAIILIIDGKQIRIEKTDRAYAKIIQVFKLPVEDQEDAVLDILSPKPIKVEKAIENHDGFDIVDEDIYYNGEKLPGAFAKKVLSIIKDELPLDHFVKFWEKLSQNPNASSVRELVDFLEYKELPITEDGHFLAYKGVGTDYYSIHGNTSTQVLQGSVDSTGHIYNGIGEVIEVLRRHVDDNRSEGCSTGLHVGSLDYARGWGPHLIVVKVDPADVVSVPSDCSFQKCRVSKYEVVSEFVEEITSSVVDSEGAETMVPNVTKERTLLVEKVAAYLEHKRDNNYDEVTVRQIQNSFSPLWVTKAEVLDALQELGEYWENSEEGSATIVYL